MPLVKIIHMIIALPHYLSSISFTSLTFLYHLWQNKGRAFALGSPGDKERQLLAHHDHHHHQLKAQQSLPRPPPPPPPHQFKDHLLDLQGRPHHRAPPPQAQTSPKSQPSPPSTESTRSRRSRVTPQPASPPSRASTQPGGHLDLHHHPHGNGIPICCSTSVAVSFIPSTPGSV